MAHIFVIAGHGAGDSGATGGGYTEAERVRALASKIRQYGGSNVTIGDTSRNWYADNGISSLNISKDWQIIELHMDSASASARGGHVIINSTFEPDNYDNALANFISKKFPGRSQSIVKRSDLANPKRAAAKGYPYRLIECGFISNSTDLSIFNSDIDEIAKGILGAFGISTGTTERYVIHTFGTKRKIYDNTNKKYIKNSWCEINDYYYYAGNDEYLLEQWQDNVDGRKRVYFIAPDWHLHAGWLSFGDTYYYCGSNGAILYGKQKIGNNWYYFDNNGVRQKNKWITDGNKKYYAMPDATLRVGWLSFGNTYYYCNSNAEIVTGLQTIDNNKYYFDKDGVRQTKWQEINGKKYWFDATTGKMLTGRITFGNTWYYLSPEDGHLMYTEEDGTLY